MDAPILDLGESSLWSARDKNSFWRLLETKMAHPFTNDIESTKSTLRMFYKRRLILL